MEPTSAETVRRRFARTPVKANAFVNHGSRFQRAQIVDYSLGGLQLDGTFGLIARDNVQIELMCGARVRGTVAWSLGGRTGVVFPEPLPETHPAVTTLARRAGRAHAAQALAHSA
jgi:hypothetical protein